MLRIDFLASVVDLGFKSYQKETTAEMAACMPEFEAFEAPKTDKMFIVVQVDNPDGRILQALPADS